MYLYFYAIMYFFLSCCFSYAESFEQASPFWMVKQIQEDLSSFYKKGVSKQDLDSFMNERGSSLQLARFSIQKGEIQVLLSKKTGCALVRSSSIKVALDQLLAREEGLPDVDFIVCLEDSLDGQELDLPVFVFAKTASNAILLPDFEVLAGHDHLLQEVLKGNYRYPWNRKKQKMIWRGAMTGGDFTCQNFLSYPRSKAIYYSLLFPSLINARFVGLNQCTECDQIRSTYSDYFASSLSVFTHMQCKYQLLIDGNSCAYSRAYWQLFSNCVTFKQESPAVQWYYADLKPYVHYIPLQNDLSDLVEKLQWAKDHDREALQISRQAQEFAKEHLSKESVLQYVYLLLKEYAALQR